MSTLDTEQLARIFSGEVKTWEALGGRGGPIHLYARDDQVRHLRHVQGTGPQPIDGKTLSGNAKRFESSEQLSDAVSQDPHGIGFIGLPLRALRPRPWRLPTASPIAMLPLNSLIATEDYPLSRRLFFYLPPKRLQPLGRSAGGLHAKVKQGQAIVAANGFSPRRSRP